MDAFNVALENAERYLKASDMTVGRRYPIISVSNEQTQYGDTKKFRVKDGEATLFTYVGKTYAKAITEGLMNDVNLHPETKCLIYLGKDGRNANIFRIV